MTDGLVKRLREAALDYYYEDIIAAAADRIEVLQNALRSIADTPLGAEIPDRTTIWGLAKHMQETAKDALEEGKDE